MVKLPPLPELERIARGLATLDAILSEDWESRSYSFDIKWGASLRLASWRDGSGDEWFLLFAKAGAFLKGLAHEYPPGDVDAIYDGLPKPLAKYLREPAFSIADTTYGGWCSGDAWVVRTGPKTKRIMAEHLALLGGDAKAYRKYAAQYFEVDVPLASIRRVLAGDKLDAALVASISEERTLAELKSDLDEIGYGKPIG